MFRQIFRHCVRRYTLCNGKDRHPHSLTYMTESINTRLVKIYHIYNISWLVDSWDRNGLTSGPIPWQVYDDDDNISLTDFAVHITCFYLTDYTHIKTSVTININVSEAHPASYIRTMDIKDSFSEGQVEKLTLHLNLVPMLWVRTATTHTPSWRAYFPSLPFTVTLTYNVINYKGMQATLCGFINNNSDTS
jgi:hypothetical protein